MCGILEVVEHGVPCGIGIGAAAMTFINDDEVKEISRKLPVYLLPFFCPGDRLIQRQIDFVVLLDLTVGDLVHRFTERGEILLHGLINKNVPIGQKEDALPGFGLPKTPDDLESSVCFAGSCGHHEQDALLPLGHRFDHPVDGDALVIARLPINAGDMIWLLHELD